MKLEKAIEIVSRYNRYVLPGLAPYKEAAIMLLIEAGKLLRDHRNEVHFRYDLPLPGETEE